MVMVSPNDERVNVLAPIVRGRKGEFKKEMAALRARGFTKVRVDGQLRSLDEDIKLDRRRNHTIEVVVDRLVLKPGIERRLTESVEIALQLADDIVLINTYDGGDRLFSRRLACTYCGVSMPEMTPGTPAAGPRADAAQPPAKTAKTKKGRAAEADPFGASFEGLIPNFRRRYEAGTWVEQEELEPYRALRPCPECHGHRLKPQSRA